MRIIIKDAKRCRHVLTITSPRGLICLGEKQCALPAGHDGPHIYPDGATFYNQDAWERNISEIVDPSKRKP